MRLTPPLLGLLLLSWTTGALAVQAPGHTTARPDFDVRGLDALNRPSAPTAAQSRAFDALKKELASVPNSRTDS